MKKLFLCISGLIIVLTFFIVTNSFGSGVYPNAKSMPLTEIKIVDKNVAKEYSNIEVDFQKANEFLEGQFSRTEDFLEFGTSDHNSKPISKEDLRTELFNVLYAAITNQNIDLFTQIFSGSSIQEVWNGELNIEKRLAILEEILKMFSRGETLEEIRYQFDVEKFDQIGDSGTLNLLYNDGIEIVIPFEITLIEGDDEHAFYQFKTSILDFKREIQSNQSK